MRHHSSAPRQKFSLKTVESRSPIKRIPSSYFNFLLSGAVFRRGRPPSRYSPLCRVIKEERPNKPFFGTVSSRGFNPRAAPRPNDATGKRTVITIIAPAVIYLMRKVSLARSDI